METVKVYDTRKRIEVTAGTIDSNTFTKKASPKHYMRKYQGYGIDAVVLAKLWDSNRQFEIIIKTKTTEYKSVANDWLSKGYLDNFGHGDQYFLAVSSMTLK